MPDSFCGLAGRHAIVPTRTATRRNSSPLISSRITMALQSTTRKLPPTCPRATAAASAPTPVSGIVTSTAPPPRRSRLPPQVVCYCYCRCVSFCMRCYTRELSVRLCVGRLLCSSAEKEALTNLVCMAGDDRNCKKNVKGYKGSWVDDNDVFKVHAPPHLPTHEVAHFSVVNLAALPM